MVSPRALRHDVRAHVWDYAVAAAMLAVVAIALIARIDVQDTDSYRFHPETFWSRAATIAVCVALVGRRRWPLRTLAVCLLLMVPLEFGHHRDNLAFFATVIVLNSVAPHLPWRLAWRAIAMIAGFYGVLVLGGAVVIASAPLIGPLFLATGFALGCIVRRSRVRQKLDADAAIARAEAILEAAELDAAAERLALAQDLHDVVAHSLSVIAVQAGIGVHLADRQPEQAAGALAAVEATCRTASTELGRLVDVLRVGGTVDATIAPALADTHRLIDHIRAAGVPVTFATSGDLRAVPAGVSLAAYRIVQEALTNVVRHAGPARATVRIEAGDDGVVVEVEDDGRGATSSDDGERSGGHGLVGMTERAEMYGGEVRTGPRPGGGFRVHAAIPYRAELIPRAALAPDRTVDATEPQPARWRPAPWMWDVVLAAFIAVLATGAIGVHDTTAAVARYRPSDALAWVLRVGCCLTLAVRRSHPTVAYTLAWLTGLALVVADYEVGPITFVLWIGLFSVANHASARRLVPSLLVAYVGTAVVAWSRPPDLNGAGAVLVALFFTASAIAGYAVRSDRERRTTELMALEEAATARTHRSSLVITTERLRIADELNSIVRRSIEDIGGEAERASRAVGTDPASARCALESISVISREALTDLRRLLEHMRPATGSAKHAPVALASAVGGPR